VLHDLRWMHKSVVGRNALKLQPKYFGELRVRADHGGLIRKVRRWATPRAISDKLRAEWW